MTVSKFTKLANVARFRLRDEMINIAEDMDDGSENQLFYFYATLAGAGTAMAETMKAAGETCGANDPQGMFETLLKQMSDAWGQAHGFPGATAEQGAPQ